MWINVEIGMFEPLIDRLLDTDGSPQLVLQGNVLELREKGQFARCWRVVGYRMPRSARE